MTEPTATAVSAPRVRPDVQAAIARAAQATGTDFSYLLAQARIESALDPDARAATSSAAGLYQFTGGTWLATLARHGDEHGLAWAQQAALSGDPALRAQVMALRFDPQASAVMAGELAGDNAIALRGVLGREPDAAELYLAHFLGGEGASRFLTALSADPGQSAAALMPRAAGANRAIFYDAGGARSVGAVMGLLRDKVEAAMSGGGAAPGPALEASSHWSAGEPAAAIPATARPSMADTLAAAFGGPAGAPAHVRAAYGQLKAFGL